MPLSGLNFLRFTSQIKMKMIEPVQDNQNGGRCPFLEAPREIRDRIYDNILEPTIEPPGSLMTRDDHVVENQRWGRSSYKRGLSKIICLGLLSCNHQVSQEMLEAISRRNKVDGDGVTYSLDLMIREEHLHPTWRSLPAPAAFVRSIEIDYQFHNHSEGNMFTGVKPSLLSRNLLEMLRGLLNHSPRFAVTRDMNQAYQKPFPHLRSLIINYMQKGVSMSLPPRCASKAIEESRPYTRCMFDLQSNNSFTESSLAYTGHYMEQVALWNLKRLIEMIVVLGLLVDKVRVIRVRCGRKIKEWEVKDYGDAAIFPERRSSRPTPGLWNEMEWMFSSNAIKKIWGDTVSPESD